VTIWRKSEKCNGAASCVEVARINSGNVAVRHSAAPYEAILVFTLDEWSAFIAGVKNGEFD